MPSKDPGSVREAVDQWVSFIESQNIDEDVKRAVVDLPRDDVRSLHMIRTDLERRGKDFVSLIEPVLAKFSEEDLSKRHAQIRRVVLLIGSVRDSAPDQGAVRIAYVFALGAHLASNLPNHMRDLRARLQRILSSM